MPLDPELFRDGHTLRFMGCSDDKTARELARRNLLEIDENQYVKCSQPGDPDFHQLPVQDCDGFIYLSEDFGELELEHFCERCARSVWPRRKRKFTSITVHPKIDGIHNFISRILCEVGLNPEVWTTGLFRCRSPRAEVQVCLVDYCDDGAPLAASYPWRDSIVFVVGNPNYLGRLPHGCRVFQLLDLATDDSALKAFHMALRSMGRFDDAGPVVAAIVSASAGRRSLASLVEPTRSLTPSGVHAVVAPPPVMTLDTNDGKRGIAIEEYRDIVKRKDDYQLFVDCTVPGQIVARILDEDGEWREVGLTNNEAIFCIEIFRNPQPTRASEYETLKKAGITSERKRKFVEDVRRKLEGPKGTRNNWNIIQNEKGMAAGELKYFINPHLTMRYAILSRPSLVAVPKAGAKA